MNYAADTHEPLVISAADLAGLVELAERFKLSRRTAPAEPVPASTEPAAEVPATTSTTN